MTKLPMNHSMLTGLTLFAVLSSPMAWAAPDYHFDRDSGQCLDASGHQGFNTGYRGECGYFVAEDLQGQDFSGLDLRGANFSEANLKGANFSKADLRGANVLYTDWNEAKFDGAIYSKASVLPFEPDQAKQLGMVAIEYEALDKSFVSLILTTNAGPDTEIPPQALEYLKLGARAKDHESRLLAKAIDSKWTRLFELLKSLGVSAAKLQLDASRFDRECSSTGPFQYAILSKTTPAVIKLLKELGANPNDPAHYRCDHPLMLALRTSTELTVALLAVGADPNYQGGLAPDQSTLSFAMSNGKVDSALALLDAGANPNFTSRKIMSIFDLLNSTDVALAQKLIDKGGKPLTLTKPYIGSPEILRILVKGGMPIDYAPRNESSRTALYLATLAKDTAGIDTALELGARVESPTAYDDPLALLIRTGGNELIDRYYLRFLDRISKTDDRHYNAYIKTRKELVQALLEHGYQLPYGQSQVLQDILLERRTLGWSREEIISLVREKNYDVNLLRAQASLGVDESRWPGKRHSSSSYQLSLLALIVGPTNHGTLSQVQEDYELLLDLGAVAQPRVKADVTPLQAAALRPVAAEAIHFIDELEHLGSKLDEKSGNDETILFTTLKYSLSKEVFQVLYHLEKLGVTVPERDFTGVSPLTFLVKNLCGYDAKTHKPAIQSEAMKLFKRWRDQGAALQPLVLSKLEQKDPWPDESHIKWNLGHAIFEAYPDLVAEKRVYSCRALLLKELAQNVGPYVSDVSGDDVTLIAYALKPISDNSGAYKENLPLLLEAIRKDAEDLGKRYHLDLSVEPKNCGYYRCESSINLARSLGYKPLIDTLTALGAQ